MLPWYIWDKVCRKTKALIQIFTQAIFTELMSPESQLEHNRNFKLTSFHICVPEKCKIPRNFKSSQRTNSFSSICPTHNFD